MRVPTHQAASMIITKYVHSCVLIEAAGAKLLFDPGAFSFEEGRVTPTLFHDVTTIAITHDHPDHVAIAALQQIVSQSNAAVIGNRAVASSLAQHGIAVTVLEDTIQQIGPFTVQAMPAQHEPILSDTLPRNTAFLVNDRVLNPGDSFDPTLLAHRGVEVVLLPIMAPWLTELAVADFLRHLRPQQVLSVHDGYAKDFFLRQRYNTYAQYCQTQHIQFHAVIEPGEQITL